MKHEECPTCKGKGRVLYGLLECKICRGTGKRYAIDQIRKLEDRKVLKALREAARG